MKHLVGRIFTIGDGAFRVVDVQRLGGDALVYAEAQPDTAPRRRLATAMLCRRPGWLFITATSPMRWNTRSPDAG